MIIEFYHNRKIDYDNFHIGFKSSLDGIVDSGLVPDDNPEVLDVEFDKDGGKRIIYYREK